MYMGRWTPLTFGLGSHNLAEVSASEFVPGQDLELVHSVWDQIVQGEDGGRLGKYLQRGPLGYLSIHTTVPTYITITRLFAKIHRNYKLVEVQHSYRFSCFSEFTTSIPVNALNSQSFINEYHNRDVLMHYQIMKNWSLPPLYAGIQLILALNQSGITVTL